MSKILIFMTLALVILANSVNASPLRVFVLLSEPLGYVDAQGKETGTHWDYMQAIAERSGIQVDMKLAPKARVLASLRSGLIDAAILFRSTIRDNDVEYVEKIRRIRVVAINRKNLPLTSYDDLRKSSFIGKMRSTFLGKKFDEDQTLKIYTVNNYDSMVRMLKRNRLDTVTGNAIVLTHLLNKYELLNSVEYPGITLGTKEQWLHMSKKSKKRTEIPRLRKAVHELAEEGIFDQILSKNVGQGWQKINKL